MTTKTTISTIAAALTSLAAMALAQGNKPAARGFQVPAEDQALTASYWTADRLANSKPMPLPQIDPATPAAQTASENKPDNSSAPATLRVLPGTPPSIPAQSESVTAKATLGNSESAPTTSQPAQATVSNFSYEFPFNNYRVPNVNMYPYSAVGRLFFVVPPGASVEAGGHYCTASVFYDSHTLLTARHCMYDYPSGQVFSNFIFFPAYIDGPNPAYNNGWTVRNLWTWVSNASTMDFDIGFLQLNDAAGYGCNGSSGTPPIWSYTGSLGVWIFGNVSQYATIMENVLAYPDASPFNGEYMFQDEAIVGATNPLGTTNIVELGNPQTDGAGGGPWIVGLNPNGASNGTNNTLNANNIITGLNSFKWTDPNQPLAINGPAFLTYNVWNLYTGYSQLPCY